MRIVMGLIAAALLSGCDVYSDNNAFNSATAGCTAGADCVSQQASKLKITTVDRLFARAGQPYVDVAGDCNEGGFSSNQVSWEILQNGASVRQCTPGTNCGTCQRGRFHLLVDFNGLGGPQNNMNVRIELTASEPGQQVQTNPLWALKTLQVQVF